MYKPGIMTMSRSKSRKKARKTRSGEELREFGTKVKKDTGRSDPEQEDEDPFDSGGMPQRDLKKNLGCG